MYKCPLCNIRAATVFGANQHEGATGHIMFDPKPRAVEVRLCTPTRHGNDEYRCLTCNRVWDRTEPTPNCED